jgi:hypothetical protein
VPGILDPNSAPDSFAPSHCKAPAFDVLVAAAALLDEDLGTGALEETIMPLGEVARGLVVEDDFVKLTVVDKSLPAEEGVTAGTLEEAGCLAADIALDVEAGIRAVEEANMLLSCVTACVFFGGSDIL